MKKLLVWNWLLFIACTLLINNDIVPTKILAGIITILVTTLGPLTGFWLAEKFCDWIGPHIKRAAIETINEELSKPR